MANRISLSVCKLSWSWNVWVKWESGEILGQAAVWIAGLLRLVIMGVFAACVVTCSNNLNDKTLESLSPWKSQRKD